MREKLRAEWVPVPWGLGRLCSFLMGDGNDLLMRRTLPLGAGVQQRAVAHLVMLGGKLLLLLILVPTEAVHGH